MHLECLTKPYYSSFCYYCFGGKCNSNSLLKIKEFEGKIVCLAIFFQLSTSLLRHKTYFYYCGISYKT